MNLLLSAAVFLALLGWGKQARLDLEQSQVYTPLAVWSILLFPLWIQGIELFAVLLFGLAARLYSGIGDGDAYLFMMYGFTASAADAPVILLSVLPVAAGYVLQLFGGEEEVVLAPYFAASFAVTWLIHLLPLT